MQSPPNSLTRLALLIVVACGATPIDAQIPLTLDSTGVLAQAPPHFRLSGFAGYETLSNGGTLATLAGPKGVIDTVDVGFGVHQVGRDSVLFLTVRPTTEHAEGMASHQLGDFTLYFHGHRTTLNRLLPYLSSCLSEPTVEGPVLVYWGIAFELAPRVYAARFNFRTRALDTLQLVGFDLPATDNCSFLPRPLHDSHGFVFGDYRVLDTFRDARHQ